MNAHLKLAGERIAVLSAERAEPDFDARFSATRRHYLYRIVNRRAHLALDADRAWFVPQSLDHAVMQAAARGWSAITTSTTFRSAHCQAQSPVRTLERLDVTRSGEVIEIRASARSFLHNQIARLQAR